MKAIALVGVGFTFLKYPMFDPVLLPQCPQQNAREGIASVLDHLLFNMALASLHRYSNRLIAKL